MNTESNDIAIIVRGVAENIEETKKCFSGYPIVFSTWKSEKTKYYPTDSVVYNDRPPTPGIGNFNYQKTTALAGIRSAIDSGFKRGILVRSDIFFLPTEKVVNLFDLECLNFLCWHKHREGYFVDYIMAGKLTDLLTLWDTNERPEGHSEKFLTDNYKNKLKDSVCVNFLLKKLNKDIDIHWSKYNIYLSSYNQYPEYSVTMD